MNDLFKQDGFLIRFLTRLCDLILLNLLFLLTFCTVVLSGAAVTALNAQTLKMVRREESSIVKGYFRALKESFLASTPATLLLFLDALLVGLIRYALHADTLVMTPALFVLLVILTLLLTAFLSWLFPLIARFENSFSGSCRNALRLALANLPTSFLLTFVNLLPLLSLRWFPGAVSGLLCFWLLIGLAAGSYGNAWYLRRCFDGQEN